MNIFITGTESGIGNELAFKALQQGHTVFATYMMDKNIHRLSQQNSPRLSLHHLDVTDTAQIKRAVDVARKNSALLMRSSMLPA
jgi:NAD dependent epimerase/dehydratase family.